MNCHICGNRLICKTDPENTDFVYLSGAKRWLDTQNATE
jgi:Saf4/Yju2 protein